MFNENKIIKQNQNLGVGGAEHKDCKEDKMLNNIETDLCKQYIHEIRNMKSLDKEMINNIRNMMSNEEKMNIIISLNAILEYVKDMLE